MGRRDLTDEQWQQLHPLLPPQKPRTGRTANDHRPLVNGILWILRTGAPWRDLPVEYGSRGTGSSRFYRWQQAGLWQQRWAKLQQRADNEGRIDWEVRFVDATVVRAHQHAAGASGGQEHSALGISRGGFSTKVHVRAFGLGKPMVFALTAGERHETTVFDALMAGGKVKRIGVQVTYLNLPDRILGYLSVLSNVVV